METNINLEQLVDSSVVSVEEAETNYRNNIEELSPELKAKYAELIISNYKLLGEMKKSLLDLSSNYNVFNTSVKILNDALIRDGVKVENQEHVKVIDPNDTSISNQLNNFNIDTSGLYDENGNINYGAITAFNKESSVDNEQPLVDFSIENKSVETDVAEQVLPIDLNDTAVSNNIDEPININPVDDENILLSPSVPANMDDQDSLKLEADMDKNLAEQAIKEAKKDMDEPIIPTENVLNDSPVVIPQPTNVVENSEVVLPLINEENEAQVPFVDTPEVETNESVPKPVTNEVVLPVDEKADEPIIPSALVSPAVETSVASQPATDSATVDSLIQAEPIKPVVPVEESQLVIEAPQTYSETPTVSTSPLEQTGNSFFENVPAEEYAPAEQSITKKEENETAREVFADNTVSVNTLLTSTPQINNLKNSRGSQTAMRKVLNEANDKAQPKENAAATKTVLTGSAEELIKKGEEQYARGNLKKAKNFFDQAQAVYNSKEKH